jgi:fumarate reductase subunit C
VATETKAKELVRPMPHVWWTHNRYLVLFMVREASSVVIAGYCVFLIILLSRARDPVEFRTFYERLASPLSLVLHLIVLLFAVCHSVTFFNLTPRVIVLFRGEEKVPDRAIAGGHYALWGLVSVVLLVIAFWVA